MLKFSFILFIIITTLIQAQKIEVANIEESAGVLASDEFLGRGSGQQGSKIAAEYLENSLKNLGIPPLLGNRYCQNVPIHSSLPMKGTKLIVQTERGNKELTFQSDFVIDESGEQTILPLPTDLVFVGYGIDAPEFSYNDYSGVDVSGKVAVFIPGEPVSETPEYFDGNLPTVYSEPRVKHKLAIMHGARGSIMINLDYLGEGKSWSELKHEYRFAYMKLATTFIGNVFIILNKSAARWLVVGSNYNLKDISEMSRAGEMKSFHLSSQIIFHEKYFQQDFIEKNVIGVIQGGDPKYMDEYVILTAHYDHLGMNSESKPDSIFNGYLDNAIGTAELLEIARVLYKNSVNLKRSIIVAFVAAEEYGLLGSSYFLYDPPVPIKNMIANINIDGSAVIDSFKSIVAVGAEQSTMLAFVEETANDQNLNLSSIPEQFASWESFNRSDQFAFAAAGIPAVLIGDGIDYFHFTKEEGIKQYLKWNRFYHTPKDDASNRVNFSAVAQHANFILSLVFKLASNRSRPLWFKR